MLPLARRGSMEEKKLEQFARGSYEYHRAKKIFENFLISTTIDGLIIIALLLIQYYQIPYIFEGIIHYLISFGIFLFPVLSIGALIGRYNLKIKEEMYDLARLEMLDDIYERLKQSN